MTKDLLPAVILFIFQGLQDEDDDVRAVAAAALVPVAEDLVLTMPQLVRIILELYTVKPVLSGHSKWTPKIGFNDRLSLNAGQNYCRMLQGEHSAILLTFIKLPFVIKAFVISIFEWPLKTGFTVTVFFCSLFQYV